MARKLNWENAQSFCKLLHNDSNLISFESIDEFHFLLEILQKEINNNLKENSYFIGMRFNSSLSAWKWQNDVDLKESFIGLDSFKNPFRFITKLRLLAKDNSENMFRQCAYLYIRSDGVNIDSTTCDQGDQKDFICKYSKLN
jgi:hypothetical protein